MSDKEPTPLSAIGEFKLIDHLTEKISIQNDNTIKGVGDDAAIVKTGYDRMLISTDMLCEGVHFDLLYTPAKHLGYKSVIVNISDILAMNATPEQITVSMAVSNRMSLEFLEEFYDGIKLACENYGVDLIGGDTTSSTSGLIISLTILGRANEEKIVKRSTAQPNDLICVSGDLGAAYMGLQLLEREKSVFETGKAIQPDFSGYDYLLERQLKPEARMDVIRAFDENEIVPTSMIDVSDGLSSDLLHICDSSSLGCSIYENKIPIDPTTVNMSEEFKIGPTTAALNGGEDYELLFTVDIAEHEKIAAMPGISIIGHMNGKNEAPTLVTNSDEVIPLTAAGWDNLQ